MAKLANFVGFQLVWFACVLGGARGAGWLGVLASALFSLSCLERGRRLRSLAALGAVGLLGAGVDSLQRAAGWVEYSGAWASSWPASLAPAWIVALWVAFGATFRLALSWLGSRPVVSVLFALLGAPVSYLGAERLDAVRIAGDRSLSLACVGLAWALGFPLAYWLEERVRGGEVARTA